MNQTVHVFVGNFVSREAACNYTEQQWEPEPDDSASDEEYEAWEDRNPSWRFREDLAPQYLSPDFIETITEPDRYRYLAKLLTRSGDAARIRELAGEANTLVLLFSGAFAEFTPRAHSTAALDYLGEYPCDLARWRE